MSEYLPWKDGLPTKPDVDTLLKAWPPETIKPGDWKVTDSEVKALIGKHDRGRYRTVYTRWVARLKNDYGLTIYREKEMGFYCATAAQVYGRTHPTIQGAGRKIGKHLRDVAISKPTNDIERITQEHQGKLLHALKQDTKRARMNLLPQSKTSEIPENITTRKEGAMNKLAIVPLFEFKASLFPRRVWSSLMFSFHVYRFGFLVAFYARYPWIGCSNTTASKDIFLAAATRTKQRSWRNDQSLCHRRLRGRAVRADRLSDSSLEAALMNGPDFIDSVVLVGFFLVVFLIFREIVMWYWKINAIIELLRQIRDEVSKP